MEEGDDGSGELAPLGLAGPPTRPFPGGVWAVHAVAGSYQTAPCRDYWMRPDVYRIRIYVLNCSFAKTAHRR